MSFSVDPPATDAELEALLRDTRMSRPEHGDAAPWDFVRKWPEAVLRSRVWPLISRLLADGDVLVRARAIEFIRDWKDGYSITTPRLVEVVSRSPKLFGHQDAEGVPIRELAALALANQADGGDERQVADALRVLSKDGPVGGGAGSVLAQTYPEFAIDQVRNMNPAHAEWLRSAAGSMSLYRRDYVIEFLQAARHFDVSAREQILETVESFIKRDNATAKMIAERYGLPTPRKDAPSVQDCRAAIGL